MSNSASPAPQVVLVVEDEILIRMMIADYLRSCGYRVLEAASGDEALVILQRLEIDVDVVFSDVENARVDGRLRAFELAARQSSGY